MHSTLMMNYLVATISNWRKKRKQQVFFI